VNTATTTNPHQAIIDGLRELAAFLAEHPDLPVDEVRVTYHVPGQHGDDSGLAEVAAIATELGVEVTGTLGNPVTPDTTHFHARRLFGPIEYAAVYIRRQAMAKHDALMSYRDNVHT
jgi:hypothetical protein